MTKDSIIPSWAVSDSVGYDIYSNEDVIVYAGDQTLTHTGLLIEIPETYYGQLKSRSGLCVKHRIVVNVGVIDLFYYVLIYNA